MIFIQQAVIKLHRGLFYPTVGKFLNFFRVTCLPEVNSKFFIIKDIVKHRKKSDIMKLQLSDLKQQ